MAGTVHNPARFDPNDYTVIDYIDNNIPQFHGTWLAEHNPTAYNDAVRDHAMMVKAWEDKNRKIFGDEWRRLIHQCHHCGQNYHTRYIAVVRHNPTGDMIPFGHICVGRLGFQNRAEFRLNHIRSAAQNARAHERKVQARIQFNSENPEFLEALNKASQLENSFSFISDILRKFGGDSVDTPTENQVSAFIKSVGIEEQKIADRKFKEAEEMKNAQPIIEGRIQITGEVLTVKEYYSHYHRGTDLKVLVRDDRGFKVFGTMPVNCERGDRITFRAEVQKKEEYFGYFKRPTKGENLREANN